MAPASRADAAATEIVPGDLEEGTQQVSEAYIYNPGRDRILERIRVGLRSAAPAEAANGSPSSSAGAIFAPVANPLERFQNECAANLMECLRAAGSSQSAQHLAQVLNSLPAGEIFVQDDPRLRELMQASQTHRAVRWSSEGAPREESQATV